MDGLEMMQILRNNQEFSQVPIIASSASVFENDIKQTLAAGADEFLPKPIQIDEFLKFLQKYLQLEWIYAQNEQKEEHINEGIVNQEIIVPPVAEIDKLFDLAMRGNVNGIENLLDNLESSDKNYQPFTTKVRHLAENFNFKQIRQYIKSFQGEKI